MEYDLGPWGDVGIFNCLKYNPWRSKLLTLPRDMWKEAGNATALTAVVGCLVSGAFKCMATLVREPPVQ